MEVLHHKAFKKILGLFKQLELIGRRFNFKLSDPISSIPKEALQIILYGGKDDFSVDSKTLGVSRNYTILILKALLILSKVNTRMPILGPSNGGLKTIWTILNVQLVKGLDLKKNPYTSKLTLKISLNFQKWMW